MTAKPEENQTIDGFLRYDAFPSRSFKARGLEVSSAYRLKLMPGPSIRPTVRGSRREREACAQRCMVLRWKARCDRNRG